MVIILNSSVVSTTLLGPNVFGGLGEAISLFNFFPLCVEKIGKKGNTKIKVKNQFETYFIQLRWLTTHI